VQTEWQGKTKQTLQLRRESNFNVNRRTANRRSRQSKKPPIEHPPIEEWQSDGHPIKTRYPRGSLS
jgi:hypothetical protein